MTSHHRWDYNFSDGERASHVKDPREEAGDFTGDLADGADDGDYDDEDNEDVNFIASESEEQDGKKTEPAINLLFDGAHHFRLRSSTDEVDAEAHQFYFLWILPAHPLYFLWILPAGNVGWYVECRDEERTGPAPLTCW